MGGRQKGRGRSHLAPALSRRKKDRCHRAVENKQQKGGMGTFPRPTEGGEEGEEASSGSPGQKGGFLSSTRRKGSSEKRRRMAECLGLVWKKAANAGGPGGGGTPLTQEGNTSSEKTPPRSRGGKRGKGTSRDGAEKKVRRRSAKRIRNGR